MSNTYHNPNPARRVLYNRALYKVSDSVQEKLEPVKHEMYHSLVMASPAWKKIDVLHMNTLKFDYFLLCIYIKEQLIRDCSREHFFSFALESKYWLNLKKNFLIDNHYKTIYGLVRRECSSCNMLFLLWDY